MASVAYRQQGYDNIKGILTFCVVFGHFLEIRNYGPLGQLLYLVIYSFHMPTFLFLSGFFARYNPRGMLRLLLLYGIFQVLYHLFAHNVLLSPPIGDILSFFLIPYWLLWYIPVLLYCQLSLLLWQRAKTAVRVIMLLLSIGISLICGYCSWIGYGLSLSRYLVFLPYFLLGSLTRMYQEQIVLFFSRSARKSKLILMILSGCTLVLSMYLWHSGQFTAKMLYGSYSYEIGYHPGIRLQATGIALVWISLFIALANTVLNRLIPVITAIGRHTLIIYLLHGFAVKLIGKFLPPIGGTIALLTALLCTIATILLLGNPITVKWFHSIFSWLEKHTIQTIRL